MSVYTDACSIPFICADSDAGADLCQGFSFKMLLLEVRMGVCVCVCFLQLHVCAITCACVVYVRMRMRLCVPAFTYVAQTVSCRRRCLCVPVN